MFNCFEYLKWNEWIFFLSILYIIWNEKSLDFFAVCAQRNEKLIETVDDGEKASKKYTHKVFKIHTKARKDNRD